jgi:site-specific recombinase XerD
MTAQDDAPLGWPAAIKSYVIAMQAANRSAGTIRVHRQYLGALASHRPRSPWNVTLADLESLIANPRWAPETRRSCQSVVRRFYRWAYGHGYVERDPSQLLPPIAVPAKRSRPAPESTVSILVAGTDRIAYMAMLGSYCALRSCEIARVHGEDVEHRELLDGTRVLFLTVHGKGDKERIIPVVHPKLVAWLDRLALSKTWAFPNGRGSHLTPAHVSRLLSGSMPDGQTAHKLRHRAATEAWRRTRDILRVAEFLGHEKVTTTQRYVRVVEEDLLDVARAAAAS